MERATNNFVITDIFLNIIGLNFFGTIFHYLFLLQKKRIYSLFSFLKACQIIIIVFSIYITILIINIASKFNEIKVIDLSIQKNREKLLNFIQNDVGSSDFFLFFALYIGFFYFKLLFELKPIRILGTLIVTIEKILLKVLKFFIIYFLILLAFSAVGTLLFCTYDDLQDQFQTFGMSVTTLIGYTFGGFSISNYSSISVNFYKGYLEVIIFCFIFLFIFYIFLINLLIGLISNIYSKIQNNNKESYLIEIYTESELLTDCSKYSSFTTSYHLIINWTFFLYLGYFFINFETINLIILKIQYFFIFCFNLSVLLIYNICLVPFIYIIGIGKFFLVFFIKESPNSKNVFGFIFFVVLGLPFLLFSALVNIIQILVLLFQTEKDQPELDGIQIIPSKKAFKIFCKELIKISDRQFSNNFNFLPTEGIKLLSSNKNEFIKELRHENKFSKIDLIFIFSLLERFSIEDDLFYASHFVTIINAEKEYLKFKTLQKKICNDLPSNKWKKFIQTVKPKVSFNKIIQKYE